MAKGEETDEHCRACVEKDALIATLQAGVAALKTTQGAMRAAMAAMEKRWCQWAEGATGDGAGEAAGGATVRVGSKAPKTCAW